jgi:hypothetical protein
MPEEAEIENSNLHSSKEIESQAESDSDDPDEFEAQEKYQDEDEDPSEIADYGYRFGHGGDTLYHSDEEQDGDNEDQTAEGPNGELSLDYDDPSDTNTEAGDEYGEYGFGSY